MYEVTDREILEKLGMAIYLHRALIKQAERAKESVDYLAGMGMFDNSMSNGTVSVQDINEV